MKEMKRFLIILIALMLLPVLSAGFVFADDEEEGTTYSIFVYSGKEGFFGKPGVTVKKFDGIKYGEDVTIDLESMDLKVKDENKYYVRGLKIAGHDNDELSSMQMKSYSLNVKEDTAFSVSYGIAGGMVKYTVKYEDEDGNKLRDSEEFYGMPGDKPVVAYKLVKGYLPDVINLAKRLSDDESENVFTFTYHKAEGEAGEGADEEGADEDGDGDADGDGADGNGTGANNNGLFFNNGQGNDDGAAVEDQDTPESGVTDLDDDQEAPRASTDKDKGPKMSAGAIAGVAGGGVLLAMLILFLLRRKKKGETE